jgi:hypothetical protein
VTRLVYLVMFMCQVEAPMVCQSVPVAEPVSAMACFMRAEEIGAQWVVEHPKWEMKGWQCNDTQWEDD